MFTRLWKIGNTTLFDLPLVGDGMLAFFNAPHAVSDHAAQAWEAAQVAQHSLDHFNQATDDAPSFQTRIALATGGGPGRQHRDGTAPVALQEGAGGRAGPLLGVTGIAGAGLPDLLTDTGTNMTELRGSPREGHPHQPVREAGKRNP